MGREDQIYREAAELWRELFREPPPPNTDGRTMLALITRHLPTSRYDRLSSPHLRPGAIEMPGGR